MKKHLLPCGIFILLFSLAAFSQSATPTPQNQTKNQTATDPDEKNSDLVITANVRARELKIEVVPNPDVKFPGKPDRQTVWEADRENLPEKIESGVTYRDIGIRLRIYSRFTEIQRIVLEALDEEPAPAVVNQAAPAETPQNQVVAPTPSTVVRKTKPKTNRTRRTRK